MRSIQGQIQGGVLVPIPRCYSLKYFLRLKLYSACAVLKFHMKSGSEYLNCDPPVAPKLGNPEPALDPPTLDNCNTVIAHFEHEVLHFIFSPTGLSMRTSK